MSLVSKGLWFFGKEVSLILRAGLQRTFVKFLLPLFCCFVICFYSFGASIFPPSNQSMNNCVPRTLLVFWQHLKREVAVMPNPFTPSRESWQRLVFFQKNMPFLKISGIYCQQLGTWLGLFSEDPVLQSDLSYYKLSCNPSCSTYSFVLCFSHLFSHL